MRISRRRGIARRWAVRGSQLPLRALFKCGAPFGEVLGIADGAPGISNCRAICIRPAYSFLNLTTGEVTVHDADPKDENLHYVGVTYQCVEYARKWWMMNKGVTFGSIDSAHEILYLTEGADIRTRETFPLARSINGTARRAPQRGDLLVYYPDRDDPEWRHGHVTVVVDVDREQGIVSVAEENYDNDPWQDPKAFARQISLFEINGRSTLLDVPPGGTANEGGGRISGWIYPLNQRCSNPEGAPPVSIETGGVNLGAIKPCVWKPGTTWIRRQRH